MKITKQSIIEMMWSNLYLSRAVIKETKSLNAALFLAQLSDWSKYDAGQDGWVSKTVKEWTESIGLSPESQLTAREKLIGLGLIEEKKEGMPRRTFYRINHEGYANLIAG